MSKLYYDTDILELFDDLSVFYKESGKNVSTNWIGISCPFCDDHSTHCGVHQETKNFSCWVCGAKGSLPKLIHQITNYEWRDVFKLIEGHTSLSNALPIPDTIKNDRSQIKLPVGVKNGISAKHRAYLLGRGMNPDYISTKYKLMQGLQFGKFKFRLVIPIIKNHQIVSLSSRDITGKSDLRYKNLGVSQSVIPVKDCVYGIDNVKDVCIITEGPFDTWATDPYGIGLFGVQYTANQLYQIYTKRFQKIIVCLDPKEQRKAKKLSMELASFVPEVKMVIIQSGKDPADAAPSEIIDIKKECI